MGKDMKASVKTALVVEIDVDAKGWDRKVIDTIHLVKLYRKIDPCESVILLEYGFIVLMEYVNDIENPMIGDDNIEIIKAMMEIGWLNTLFEQAKKNRHYQVHVEIDYTTNIRPELTLVNK